MAYSIRIRIARSFRLALRMIVSSPDMVAERS